MGIPASEWRWFGRAGHHICSPSCQHHLHTRVGNWRISTVGDYFHKGEFHDVGLDRKYETYVFRISGECSECDPPCLMGDVSEWNEVEGVGAKTAAEAEANHLALCQKYADRGDV